MEAQGMKKIPVVLALTPNYFVAAATCLLSIFRHAAVQSSFHIICLMAEQLSAEQQADLQRLSKTNAEYTFLNLEGQFSDVFPAGNYPMATMLRLLIPDLLPQYDKIFYLDCDLIVRHDLEKLYLETDLGDNYLAGVKEAPLSFQWAHLREIAAEAAYINAGFLLMNLKALRQDNIVLKFFELAQKGGLEFFDQDILNMVCKGRILFLPPYHNSIRTFFLPQYKAEFLNCYTEKEYQAVLRNGTLHYTGAKPWNTFTVHFKTWWQYYETLPAKIRGYGQVNPKMQLLYRFYANPVGETMINVAQSIFRKLKSGSL